MDIASTLNAHPLMTHHRLHAVAGTTRQGTPGLFLDRVSRDGRRRERVLKIDLATGQAIGPDRLVCKDWPLGELSTTRHERFEFRALDSLIAGLVSEVCPAYVAGLDD